MCLKQLYTLILFSRLSLNHRLHISGRPSTIEVAINCKKCILIGHQQHMTLSPELCSATYVSLVVLTLNRNVNNCMLIVYIYCIGNCCIAVKFHIVYILTDNVTLNVFTVIAMS